MIGVLFLITHNVPTLLHSSKCCPLCTSSLQIAFVSRHKGGDSRVEVFSFSDILSTSFSRTAVCGSLPTFSTLGYNAHTSLAWKSVWTVCKMVAEYRTVFWLRDSVSLTQFQGFSWLKDWDVINKIVVMTERMKPRDPSNKLRDATHIVPEVYSYFLRNLSRKKKRKY